MKGTVGESDTVFVLRAGATLRNVIIGKDQAEGVYCLGGGCTIENVWFEDVCEDAISIVRAPRLEALDSPLKKERELWRIRS